MKQLSFKEWRKCNLELCHELLCSCESEISQDECGKFGYCEAKIAYSTQLEKDKITLKQWKLINVKNS